MDYRLNSFKPLETLRGMRRLQIFHFPHVTNLEPLGLLSQLEELTLETLPGGDASGRTKIVKSFWPLASLRELRVLRLAGVRAEDEDLSPIGALKALQDLALGNFFPQRQFAMLATRLPKARCSFLAPFLELEENVCRKCGGKKVLLSGADLPNPKVVCPVCQRKKFDASVANFERFMREQAESSGEPEPPISRDLKS